MTIAVATAEDLPFIDKEHHVQSVSRALANFNISADRSIRELKVHFVRTGQARRFRDGPAHFVHLFVVGPLRRQRRGRCRSEEHTSELQSLMRISYAVFCLKKKNKQQD